MAKFLDNKYFSIIRKHISCMALREISFCRMPPIKESPYLIVRPTRQEFNEILDLMWKDFYPDEPTYVCLGLGNKRNSIMEDGIMKSLTQGYSFVAKCKYTGRIVGASVNRVTCKWDADLLDKFACTLSCSAIRQLFHFYAHLQRAPKLYETFCESKVFEISDLVVKRDDRGKGVGLMLLKASKDLGADCGFYIIRVDCTSYYTAQICEKMKMKLYYELPYCGYIGTNNEPVFKPPLPHTAAKVYIHLPHAIPSKK